MTLPKVSVVIPVFKVENYIEQCINSVLNQTYKNLEIILVNDGSPDRSGEICDSFAARDSRIRLLHQPNLGGCFAMQNGLDMVTSDYMMFLDGDDWLEPETCEVSITNAVIHQADVVFWTRIKEFSDHSEKVNSLFPDGKVFRGEELSKLRRRFIGLINEELARPTETDALSACWGKLFATEVFRKNPYAIVDAKGNQNFDAIINIIVFKDVQSAVSISNHFSHYRRYNANSITKNHGYSLRDKYLDMFDRIEVFMKQNVLFADADFTAAFHNRIALSVINITQSITGPSINQGALEKIRFIHATISHPRYQASLSQFRLRYLALHWKVFFLCCKMKLSPVVYFLGVLMRKARRIRSK